MSRVYLIISCFVIAAEAVLSAQQNQAAVVVDLYHQKLNYFDSFLSPSGIDNLILSVENITPETVRTLRQAWISYTSLRGEIIFWCTEVINTAGELGQSPNQLNFASKVYEELNQMKGYFNSIATNGIQGQDVEDYKAVITFAGGVRNFEVINGRTPNNIEVLLLPLLEKSKFQANVTDSVRLTTLNDKLNHAKNITAEAIREINSATNEVYNRDDVIAKCRPILDKLSTSRRGISTSPPQYAPPSQRINPSPNDSLRAYPNSCGGYLGGYSKTKCEAVLSKSTIERLKKLYHIDESVSDLFNAISQPNLSSKCKDRIKSFIKQAYLSWAYEVDNMGNTQSLKISICLNTNLHPQVRAF